MTETTQLVCPRHKVETPLTCVTCETPICPKCYVRTAVGLRCPVCAQGITVKLGGRRRWPFVAAAAVVVIALVGVLVASGSDSGDGDAAPDVVDSQATGEGGAALGYRLISKPAQGFSVEVPVDWQVGADDSDTNLSYAKPRSTEGSLRVSVNPADAPLADLVTRLTGRLTAEGGVDFARRDTQVSGQPAIRLTYRFPTSSTPGSTLAARTSILVVNKGNVLSFQLATTDPSGTESVFAYLASKFTLL